MKLKNNRGVGGAERVGVAGRTQAREEAVVGAEVVVATFPHLRTRKLASLNSEI